MPPAKKTAYPDDLASRDKPATAATTARKNRNGGASAQQNGTTARDLPAQATASSLSQQQAPGTGMAWQTAPRSLLETYRVAYQLPISSSFTTPRNHALLTNAGLGRQSPTMARAKDKRRVSREQLALAVRKNFNGAAVSEIDVVVDLMYKVRNQDKAFRMRSTPGVSKKPPG